MACNMREEIVNGKVIWWMTSCRSEHDWYALTYGGSILADHLPTKEEAEKAGAAVIASAKASGTKLNG